MNIFGNELNSTFSNIQTETITIVNNIDGEPLNGHIADATIHFPIDDTLNNRTNATYSVNKVNTIIVDVVANSDATYAPIGHVTDDTKHWDDSKTSNCIFTNNTTCGITTGLNNIAIGVDSASGAGSAESGTSVFIGKDSGASTTVTNSVALGTGATVGLSNQIMLGNTAIEAVEVGSAFCSLGSVANPLLNLYSTNATIPSIAYDNTISGVNASTVKTAIDELKTNITDAGVHATIATKHWDDSKTSNCIFTNNTTCGITTGLNNISIGVDSAVGATDSGTSVFIGKDSGASTTVANSVALGTGATVGLSNQIMLGNTAIEAVEVGSAFCSLGSVANPLLNLYSTNATIPAIAYDNTTSNLSSTTVKTAIDELKTLVALTGTSEGGEIFYLNKSIASDIGGYFVLGKNLTNTGEILTPYTLNLTAGTKQLLDSFATPIDGLTVIPQGLAQLGMYSSVDSLSGVTTISWEIYKRSVGGVETLLFTSAESPDSTSILTSVPDRVEIDLALTNQTILTNDRIIIKIYATKSTVADRILTVNYEGNTFYSHFHSTFTGLEPYNLHIADTTKHWRVAGSNSIVYGLRAGETATSASGSILIGIDCGKLISNGFDNTIIGHLGGSTLTTANYNTAVGKDVFQEGTGNSNTLIGCGSGKTVSGDFNVCLGRYNSGFPQITSGSNNICLGTDSGINILSSSNCVLIGTEARTDGGVVSNSIGLGTGVNVNDESNVCVIGNTALTAIKSMSSVCDLGSVAKPFQKVYALQGDIPLLDYDNTISGLTATNVKSAIDEVKGNVSGLTASDITMDKLLNSGYSTVQHMQDTFHSSGLISDSVITNNGDGSVAVPAGEGYIRASEDVTSPLLFGSWLAVPVLALTDNAFNYIIGSYVDVNYIGITATTVKPTGLTTFTLATVHRAGTVLHISASASHKVSDHANRMINRMNDTMYIQRAEAGGAILSAVGTRNIAITQGNFWSGLTNYTTNAFNSSTGGTFRYFYNRLSYVEVTTNTQISNLQYDLNGVLTDLGNNAYGCHYVYLGIDSDVYVIYGIGSYTLTQALDATSPSNFPSHFQKHAILIGKIIIQKSATSFTSVISAFTGTLQSGSTSVNVVNGIADDNAIARFDANGNTIQNSGVIIDDSNNITGVATLTATKLIAGQINLDVSTIEANPTFDLNLVAVAGGEVMIDNDPTRDYSVVPKIYVDTSLLSKVTGPASSIADIIPLFDGLTGKLVKTSGVAIDVSNNITGVNNLTMSGEIVLSSTTTAFTPPKLTTTQRNLLTAVEGNIIYDTTVNKLSVYDKTSWSYLMPSTITAVKFPESALTSNSTVLPSGTWTVSASSVYTTYTAYKAFDGVLAYNQWASANGTFATATGLYLGIDTTTVDLVEVIGPNLQLQAPVAKTLKYYSINTWRSYPRSWVLAGSNDGSTWNTIDSRTDVFSAEWTADVSKYFNVAVPASYSYYKIIIVRTNGGYQYCTIGELYFYEEPLVNIDITGSIDAVSYKVGGTDGLLWKKQTGVTDVYSMPNSMPNNTGSYIINIGDNSLALNTSGSQNTAIGNNTLTKNTVNQFNVAVGGSSGKYSTGSGNCFVGIYSAEGVDTFSTGSYNTAIGGTSMRVFTSAHDCVALGYASGNLMTTAVNTTLLGGSTNCTTQTNSTAVGYGALIEVDDEVVLGNAGIGRIRSMANCDIGSPEYEFKNAYFSGSVIQPLTTPATANSLGDEGMIRWDANYIYIAVGSDIWKRVAIATW